MNFLIFFLYEDVVVYFYFDFEFAFFLIKIYLLKTLIHCEKQNKIKNHKICNNDEFLPIFYDR